MQVPDSFTVPDVDLGTFSYSTPNDASTFLQPDGETLIQLQPTTRITPGGPIWGYPQTGWQAGNGLHGDGTYGTHYGSGLSAIGGSIRKGEISSSKPIRHALKIELSWTQLFFNPYDNTDDKATYRWPAKNSDGGADGSNNPNLHYSGTNPSLREGSLLALLPGATEQSLGLKTAQGKKLFHAFQDYGAYVVDTSGYGGNYANIPEESGVETTELTGWGNKGAFYDDMNAIYSQLQVVDNNSPTSIGGGGTPRAPFAPPLADAPAPGLVDGATYTLSSATGGLCVEVWGASKGLAATVGTYYCNGQANQNWTLHDVGDDRYALVGQDSGLCLDDAGAGITAGTHVQQWTCINYKTQYWRITPDGSGAYTLLNENSSLMLEDPYASTSPTELWQYWTNGTPAQSWVLRRQP